MAHAPPASCSHLTLTSPPCNCPEYEPSSPSSLSSPCDLCDHALEWHLPPLSLSILQGKEIKSRGEEALERCKERFKGGINGGLECGCPVFVKGETAECALCGHKKGWHKWKDVSSSLPAQMSPYPISPTSSSGSSAPFSPHFHPAQQQQHAFVYPTDPTYQSQQNLHSPYSSPPARSPSVLRRDLPSPQRRELPSPSLSRSNSVSSNGRRELPSPSVYHQAPYYPVPSGSAQRREEEEEVEVVESPTTYEQPGIRVDKGKGRSQSVESLHSLTLSTGNNIPSNVSSATSSPTYFAPAPMPSSPPPPTRALPTPSSPPTQPTRPPPTQPIAIPPPSSSLAPPTPPSPVESTFSQTSGMEAPEDPEYYRREVVQPLRQLAPRQGVISPRSGIGREIRGSATAAGGVGTVGRGEAVAEEGDTLTGTITRELGEAPRYRPPVPPSRRRPSVPSTTTELVQRTAMGLEREAVGDRERETLPPPPPPLIEAPHHPPEETETASVASTSTDGPIIPAPLPVAVPTPVLPQWKTYESRNMLLAITPPLLDGRKIRSGQVFQMQLKLGPKVSLSNFDKIEVKLIGNSYVYGEPPDSHDFMSIRASVFPASPDIQELGHGQRAFMWSMTIPKHQTCDCRPTPLPLPPSYGHSNFRVDYRVELIAKKHKRFNMNATEKTNVHFPLYTNFVEPEGLTVTPSNATMKSGVDGPWRTVSSSKIIIVDGQQATVNGSELAWQILPAEGATVKISYRVSLNFGQLPPSQYLNEQVLSRLEDSFRISLSRRITLSKSGRKPSKEDTLPALRVAFKEVKERAAVIVDESGLTMWRYEGYLEVATAESRSMTTCNASVRYMLSAKALQTVGLSSSIDLIARTLALEIPTVPGLARAESTRSSISTTSSTAAAAPLNRPSSFRDTFTPIPIASTSTARLPPEPVRGFQLQDGPRPPSIAGSSIYRVPIEQRATYSATSGSLDSSRSFWPQDRLPEASSARPNSSHSHSTVQSYSDDPPDLLPITSPVPSSSQALGLPPDFDEFVPDHEPTPAYEDAVREGLVEMEEGLTNEELITRAQREEANLAEGEALARALQASFDGRRFR